VTVAAQAQHSALALVTLQDLGLVGYSSLQIADSLFHHSLWAPNSPQTDS